MDRTTGRLSTAQTVYRIVFIVLTVCVMAVIFMFSGEDSEESSDRSGGVTCIAAELFVSGFDDMTPPQQEEVMNGMETIIRKLAHFSVYTALGFCVSMAVGRRRLLTAGTAGALIFCFLYACSDEIHQFFVPGRSCEFRDVLIDTSGALTGMLLSLGILSLITSLHSKHHR